MNILISGGTGFIGSALCNLLVSSGHSVTVLSRKPDKVSTFCGAQVKAIKTLESLPVNSQIDVIINLAGAPIADARWTLKRKKLLLSSRINTTRQIIDFISRLTTKPKVLISSSAVGYYGDRGDTILDEESGFHDDFAHNLCAQWEHAASEASDHGVRVCLLRIGLVIGEEGGFLKRMILPFKFGLGGRLGDGQQWMSWIHRQDLINMIEMLINTDHLKGVFNGTAPNPVTNSNFTKTLANCLNRFAIIPAPAFVLKLALGEMSVLLLGGQRVIPKRFLDEGFSFQYETLESALKDVVK